METLRSHGLPAQRIDLGDDPVSAVRRLNDRIAGLLNGS
jgi:hypothetical protein